MLLMLSAAFHGGLGTGVNFNFSFAKARPAGEAVDAKTTVKGRLPIELRAGYRFFLKNCGWFVDPVVTFNTDFGRIQKDAFDVAAAPAVEGAAAAPAAPGKKSFKEHVPFLSGLVGLDIRVGKVFGRNLAVYAFLPIPELAYAAVTNAENKKELNLKFFGVSTGVGAEYKLHRNVSVTGALKVGAFKSTGADWTLKTRALVGVEVHQSNYYGD